MKKLFPTLLSLALLAGCASPGRPAQVAVELQQSEAVKERYWQIQEAQRTAPLRSIALRIPEHTEGGAIRVPSTLYLPCP